MDNLIERLFKHFEEQSSKYIPLDGLSEKESIIAKEINKKFEQAQRCETVSKVYLQALTGTEHFYEMSIRALSALIRVGMLGEEVKNIEALCENTLDIFSEELDFENCSIMLKDTDKEYLTLVAGRGKGDRYISQNRGVKGKKIKIGEGIAGKVAETGEHIFIPDVTKDGRFKQTNMRVDVTSLLSLPLKSEKNIIGVINFSHPILEAFDENKINLMVLLSNFAGQMISLTKLHNKIARWNEILRAMAIEMERLHFTIRSIGDGVIITDISGKIVLINEIAENLTGCSLEKIIDRPFNEVFLLINKKTDKYCDDPIEKVLKSGNIISLSNDTVLVACDNAVQFITASCAPIFCKENKIIGAILIFRDITKQKELEEELLKTHKLESIGTLAGGIAHDFNNLLTAILGNISLAKMFANSEEKIFSILTNAENASNKAKDLTQKLLTFSRGGVPVMKTSSISELLEDSLRFILSGSNVTYELSIQSHLPAEIDERQMSQAINNLIINAKETMPDGGVIKVNCENITIEKGQGVGSKGQELLEEGRYIKISIKDQGYGIPDKNIRRIFDPYFTTKEMGAQKGCGLGLAISHSIITRHGGHIAVESQLGAGATFNIYLPVSEKHHDNNFSLKKELRLQH